MTSMPAIFGFSQTIPEKLLSALIIYHRSFAAILHVFLPFSIIHRTEVGVLMASLQRIRRDPSRSAWVWTRNGESTNSSKLSQASKLLLGKRSWLRAAARLQIPIRSQVRHKEARLESSKERGVWTASRLMFDRLLSLRGVISCAYEHTFFFSRGGDMRECTETGPVWYPPAGPGGAITAA